MKVLLLKMKPWKVNIITSLPDIFPGPLGYSLVGNALKKGIWSLGTYNLRDFSIDKRGSIDDYPFGGGPGMIIRPDVVEKSLKKSLENMETEVPLVYMTPVGKPLVQKKLEEFSKGFGLIILCGKFEGIDERILDAYNFERISIGDYILSGGEIAAMALVEGCVRLLPSVIGKEESLINESFKNNLLEYPQYTQPRVWSDQENKKHNVPDILLSGDHKKIAEWREQESIKKTGKFRPDLLKKQIIDE